LLTYLSLIFAIVVNFVPFIDAATALLCARAVTRQTQHRYEQVDEFRYSDSEPIMALRPGGTGIVVPVINLQIKFPVIGLEIPVPRNKTASLSCRRT
jgi:hypothetical protein